MAVAVSETYTMFRVRDYSGEGDEGVGECPIESGTTMDPVHGFNEIRSLGDGH